VHKYYRSSAWTQLPDWSDAAAASGEGAAGAERRESTKKSEATDSPVRHEEPSTSPERNKVDREKKA
jgi:hypothetical protein